MTTINVPNFMLVFKLEASIETGNFEFSAFFGIHLELSTSTVALIIMGFVDIEKVVLECDFSSGSDL